MENSYNGKVARSGSLNTLHMRTETLSERILYFFEQRANEPIKAKQVFEAHPKFGYQAVKDTIRRLKLANKIEQPAYGYYVLKVRAKEDDPTKIKTNDIRDEVERFVSRCYKQESRFGPIAALFPSIKVNLMRYHLQVLIHERRLVRSAHGLYAISRRLAPPKGLDAAVLIDADEAEAHREALQEIVETMTKLPNFFKKRHFLAMKKACESK